MTMGAVVCLLGLVAVASAFQRLSMPLPVVYSNGATEFHLNQKAAVDMLKKLDLTSIAYKTNYKIGTVSQMKGLGYWNPQGYADGLTPKDKTKAMAKDMTDLKAAAQKKGIHVRGKRSLEEEDRLDLGDKIIVFLAEDIVEHIDE